VLFGAKVVICSQINTVGQNVNFLNVKPVGASGTQQVLKGQLS
jgi:hypothetical protein